MIKSEYDVIVVGAGPAGSMASKFAAEQGVSVLMLEKDRDVGYPVRCAEAINKPGCDRFITPDKKWITAEVRKFSFTAPNGNEISVDSGHVMGYVLERRIFDYELAKLASNAGAQVVTRAYVNGLIMESSNKVCGVKFEYRGEQREARAKVVIGADGTESRVGRWAGLQTHTDFRDMEACVQVTATNVNINTDTLYFHFGKDVAPNGYFWVFPKGQNIANIGLGISGYECKKRSTLSYLTSNLERLYPNASILTQVAGGVPCCITLEKISGEGIMLVGDAARQVNPLSGGGIESGMVGGSIAGRIAGETIKKGNLKLLYNYDKEWHKERGKNHEIYDRLKNGIYNFTDDDFNNLITKFRKVEPEKRTMRKLFMIALAHKPSLLVDVAKVFL